MRRRALLVLALAGLAGCGDPALWARWQAERMLWKAHVIEARGLHGGTRRESEWWDALERRYLAVPARFPASRWAAPLAPSGPARQVALAAAEADLAYASIALKRGRAPEAERRFAEALHTWGVLPRVAVRARLGEAEALDRLGRFEESLALRLAVAGLDPLADSDARGPTLEVLEAPGRAVTELRVLGRDAEATQALALADRRFSAALARCAAADSEQLILAITRVRVARSDPAGALAVLRAGLRRPGANVPGWLLAMAQAALDAGAPDSALACARQAEALNGARRIAAPALLAMAKAFEATGHEDSALARLDAVFDRWPDPGPYGAFAREHRARLLEHQGQWERARAEYRALAAADPSHPLAMQAVRRVVLHELERGEPEMARIAGENGLEQMGRLLETNRDPQVQRLALAVRGDLQLALGATAAAESTLVDLWRQFPEDSLAEDAALRAAVLAAHRPDGGRRAAWLLTRLARGASNPFVRHVARTRLAESPPR